MVIQKLSTNWSRDWDCVYGTLISDAQSLCVFFIVANMGGSTNGLQVRRALLQRSSKPLVVIIPDIRTATKTH